MINPESSHFEDSEASKPKRVLVQSVRKHILNPYIVSEPETQVAATKERKTIVSESTTELFYEIYNRMINPTELPAEDDSTRASST